MSQQPTAQIITDSEQVRKLNHDKRAFLRKHVEKYKNCTSAAQKQEHVGKIGHEFLKKFFPAATGLERDAVKRMIKTFFSNTNWKTTPSAKFWNKSLTRRDVSYRKHRAAFLAKVGGMPRYMNAHGRVNLGQMQREFSMYEQSELTPQQRAEVTEEWKSYRDKPYPEDIQIEYNRKYSAKYNWAVDHSAQNKMGQYRFTLIIATGENGRLEVNWVDHIPSFLKCEVNRFKEQFPVEFSNMYNTWIKYAQYLQAKISQMQGDHISNNIPDRNTPPGPQEIVLERNDAGFPIMLGLTERTATAKYTMQLMRAYLNAQYCIARGGERSKAPLKSMTENPDMLEPGSLPENFIFKDPSLLSGRQTLSFCQHILDRQTCMQPHEVFRFRRILAGRTSTTEFTLPKYDSPLDESQLARDGHKKRASRVKSGTASVVLAPNTNAQSGEHDVSGVAHTRPAVTGMVAHVPGFDAHRHIAGIEAEPMGNVPGIEPQPARHIPGIEPQPGRNVPGIEPQLARNVTRNQPQHTAHIPGIEPQPARNDPGNEPQPARNVTGIEPQHTAHMPGIEPQPARNVTGIEPQPGRNVTGIEPQHIAHIPGIEPQPARNVTGIEPQHTTHIPGIEPQQPPEVPGTKRGRRPKPRPIIRPQAPCDETLGANSTGIALSGAKSTESMNVTTSRRSNRLNPIQHIETPVIAGRKRDTPDESLILSEGAKRVKHTSLKQNVKGKGNKKLQ